MNARPALAIRLLALLAFLAFGGCTGGVYVQYPSFPDRSCGTCVAAGR